MAKKKLKNPIKIKPKKTKKLKRFVEFKSTRVILERVYFPDLIRIYHWEIGSDHVLQKTFSTRSLKSALKYASDQMKVEIESVQSINEA